MQIRLNFLIAIALLLMGAKMVPAQQAPTEDVVINNAAKYFSEKNYEKAFPLYSQIVSNHPDNAVYNYGMGVCILKAGSDRSEAIRFLVKASASPQNPVDAWLYLAQAYHAASRFEDAIAALDTYKLNCNKNVWETSQGETLLTMCRNGLKSRNDFAMHTHRILEISAANRDEFSKFYQELASSGRFLRLPKDYEEKATKNQPESSMLFLSSNSDMMVFSNKGKEKDKGFELFKVMKDPKGLWKFPETFPGINTQYDEAYPVLVNNGNTVYFSSNGPQSIGGYDIFKSDFDATTQKWSEPVSLGPPVNSPGNDYFYLPSNDKRTAWFSSDRESAPGKCTVYKAAVLEPNRSFITIDGLFDSQAGAEISDATITIINHEDRMPITQFTIPAQKGAYKLRVPASEKVIYKVEVPGFQAHEASVDFSEITSPHCDQTIFVNKLTDGSETLHISFAKNKETVAQNSELKNTSAATETKREEAVSPVSIVNTESTPANTKAEAPSLVSVVNTNATVDTHKDEPAPLVSVVNTTTPAIEKVDNHPAKENAVTATPGNNETAPLTAVNEMALQETSTPADDNKNATAETILPAENTVDKEESKNRKNRLFARKEKRYFPEGNYPVVEKKSDVPVTEQPVADEVQAPAVPAAEARPTLENVVFRVQLGAFKKGKVDDLKKRYEAFGLTNLVYVKNEQNLLLVMTGSEKTYKSAVELKEKIKANGVNDAFIVVYSEGERLPVAMFETSEE